MDDTHTMNIGYNHYDLNNPPDPQKYIAGTDFGQMPDRPYRERQLLPGDYDAQVSMGPTAVHAREHLASTDAGVSLFRRLVKRGIRDVEDGGDPIPAPQREKGSIRTYAHDTIQRIPASKNIEDDKTLLHKVGTEVTEEILAGKYPR